VAPAPWVSLLGADPLPWLSSSDEPAARWVTLTHLADLPAAHPEVAAAHRAVLADVGTADLVGRLGTWGDDTGASGHHSPGYRPNLLQLLADLGVRAGDIPAVDAFVDALLEHQDAAGRFEAFGKLRGRAEPAWTSLPCDSHLITEVLIRFGRADQPAVVRSVERIAADLAHTAQGPGWLCLPERVTGFRGPGRRHDLCPMVTLEALRLFARLPPGCHPSGLRAAARSAVRAWRERAGERPYLFGHGSRYKTVKWPTFWYGAFWALDTLGRFPELWKGATAEPDDRQALAEMLACLVAYNCDPSARVTPRSCYQGFEGFSFGQKKRPSPFATARLAAVVKRLDDLADDAARIDVPALGGGPGSHSRPVSPGRPGSEV
jgi:hypothetical protein